MQQLRGGTYTVEVTDSKGCKGSVVASVPSPLPLLLTKRQLQQPICAKDCNGSIAVLAAGGSAPYRYGWDTDVATTATLTNRCAGSYVLTVKDSHQCNLRDTLTLVDPQRSLSLGDSAVICKGQVVNLDAGIVAPQYDWYSTNGFKSNAKKVTLKEAGKYNLSVTTAENCTLIDSFTVITSSKLLQAHFLMIDKAVTNDTINIIEYSWPAPEQMTWTLPPDFELVPTSVNPEWQYVKVSNPGSYTIKLTVSLGECKDELEKTIIVLDPAMQDNSNRLSLGFSGISQANLFPNPNTGVFAIQIALTESMPVELGIYDIYRTLPVYTDARVGHQDYTINLSLLTLEKGAYYLKIKTEQDLKIIKFLVQ